MHRASEQYFVLTLPLKPEIWQQHVLEKRFEINRQIYNALLAKACRRYRQMIQTRAWRANQERLSEEADKEARKRLLKERDLLIQQYRLRKYDICHDATPFRQHFSEHTDSPVVQNLAAEVWQAVDALIRERGTAAREKAPGQLRSLSGKTNNSSIKYREGVISWKGLLLPVGFKGNAYESQALKKELRFCRIKRESIRGKERYFAELVLKGTPPVKSQPDVQIDGSSGRIKVPGTTVQKVGIKAGFWKIAAVSEQEAILCDLPGKRCDLEYRKRKLTEYMERSRRGANPENYLPDGRIREGSADWKASNRYRKVRSQYQELCRKQRALQREEQFLLARRIASMGDRFYIEEINFLKLGKRKPNSAGMQQSSPAAFMKVLRQKLCQQEKEVLWIQPFTLKASGFNHHTGSYQKMPLKKSWRIVDGQKVDKKLYSAFLLSNTAADQKGFDTESCREKFPLFLKHQKEALERYEKESGQRSTHGGQALRTEDVRSA